MHMKMFDIVNVSVRKLFVSFALMLSMRLLAVGWTPTDAGLVVDLEPGDQFLLSVMVEGTEYFVCHYPSYTGGPYKYTAGHELRLIPQTAGATVPSEVSVWTVDTALTRVIGKNNYALGGISYTMWSSSGYTLITASNSDFKFLGNLSNDASNKNLCDVVFVVPTNRASTNMDPNNTLGKKDGSKWAFDGAMGTGFAGMTYREVYMFDIPRTNGDPKGYTNASLVTFNTTSSNKTWGGNTVVPGKAAYAYADSKHSATTRTLFRLYLLNDREFSSCNSYFFGWDIQDYKKYRQSNVMTDSTLARKIYTVDRFECMTHQGGESKLYKTDYMWVPASDSAYYYVGYKNKYRKAGDFSLGAGTTAISEFTKIRELRVNALKGEATTYTPSAGACGRMVVDTTSDAKNLGVTFEPAGYFLRSSRGRNVPLRPNADSTVWTCEEKWDITEEYYSLSIKATLFTGPDYREDDPGADIPGWSELVDGKDVPVYGHPDMKAKDQSGWARIYTNSAEKNGNMEFVLARTDRHIEYDYNGLIGVAIPNQYPAEDAEVVDGKITLKVEDAQLKAGFTFSGWATTRDGAVAYHAGDDIQIPEGTTTLYAVGTFDDTYRVAFSFMEGGKRYFLTHPNSSAPRYARARTFTDWTDVYQGMSDAENSEPNFVSTYKMIGNPTCALCTGTEYVLDPQHETVHGVEDSLTFYEYWAPKNDEYIGLYYLSTFNTVLANNTWAGAFQSTEGWPAYNRPAVDSTKLFSANYFTGMNTGDYKKKERVEGEPPTSLPPYIKYDASHNQFDGEAVEANGTTFQISAVAVADAHYVILPDTNDATTSWTDSITFDYHKDEQQYEQVWSKLIGKQLMACMMVGKDTTYFHPNRSKTMNNANDLRLSLDYRLYQDFVYLRDRRVADQIAEGDSAFIEQTENGFCCNVTSGASSPIGISYEDKPVDIYDTLRVWLRPGGKSKIKDYYGRWKRGAKGLHIASDGSRYRDILVKTKTYHYGATGTRLVLEPKQNTYNFGALAGQKQQITFALKKETYRQLLDVNNRVISEEVVSTKDTTSLLALSPSDCSLLGGTFTKVDAEISGHNVTLQTAAENTSGVRHDTLTITKTITMDAVNYDVTVRVPLQQVALQGTELVWSVVDGGKRYFIMAKSDGLVYREYSLRNATLYKQNTTTVLIKGAYDASNSKTEYITPWTFTYPDKAKHPEQIELSAASPISKSFAILTETTPGVGASASTLSFKLVHANTNDNANYEEKVKLQYGSNKWLKFDGGALRLTDPERESEADATIFSWSFLQQEYNLLNNGTYPSVSEVEFGEGAGSVAIKTAYKGYREYTMLLDSTLTYLCREERTDSTILANENWKTTYAVTLIHDSRFKKGEEVVDTAKLRIRKSGFTTTVTPTGDSPTEVMIDGKYVDIVDTLQVTLGAADGAPAYRFKDWKGVASFADACLKIPLVRKTYHEASYDSIACMVERDEYKFAFPSTITKDVNDTYVYHLTVERRQGTNVMDVDNNVIDYESTSVDTLTEYMNLTDAALAEIRLADEFGNTPGWCEISDTTASTLTIKCTSNGVRAPRSAYLYFAFIVNGGGVSQRFVNFRLTVSQASLFQYQSNQTLVHSKGASGDPLLPDGRQQAHENRRILYYYNPVPYNEADQNVELPVRERGFYGWWRWYREGKDERNFDCSDMDILDTLWITPPTNVGRYNYPFRIIGDSVDDGKGGKKLVTMGRYTVFHYPAREYNTKVDPPAKSPQVFPPINKDTVTYVVDLGAYYDNLPLSMKYINQVDTAVLDTMTDIIEPTLSLREVFELHPWTEMAEKLEAFKDTIEAGHKENTHYLEDHEVMAPIGNRLLLTTEQRYRYANLAKKGHSESLLGYYMRDDNYSTWPGDKDTMIWCGGWDAECEWYTYNPKAAAGSKYTECNHPVTEDDDFLNVPAKSSLTGGAADTVYYCLRARSKATTGTGKDEKTVDGAYWFNICRYKIIYHDPRKFGPLQETKSGGVMKALITNDDIEQNYEVLERLNFDYNKPGKDYQVYPHPLPWADASYGYSYPVSPEVPDNRYHNDFAPNFPGTGEYGIVNRIPYSNYWHKMEQHGGAENGYMIYCDGMSSAGQVAALSLETQLCEGQKMFFSGYVGNPSNQKGKSNPNFIFSVQGSSDGRTWTDITSYMTGDIQPSDKWSQIFFPINQEGTYDQFRIRIYNVASDFDGNDFIIDDMCIFATKPPLIAYQANTECVKDGVNDSITNVVLRVDYQGFVDTFSYNTRDVYYTVQMTNKAKDTTFVAMLDGYLDQVTKAGKPAEEDKPATPDTVYGVIHMPAHTYVPINEDSVFTNLNHLVDKFTESNYTFKKGYLYENLDGVIRPVLYVVHQAKMTADNKYTVRMATGAEGGLMSSKCAMTSDLKVTNRMMFELNGEEQDEQEVEDMCANATYDLSVRVKGSLFLDSVAPLDVNGSCINDWLLYGDTAEDSSKERYGYKYSDIKKVITGILRREPTMGQSNTNLHARSLAEVSRNELIKNTAGVSLSDDVTAYQLLSDLVNNGFLTLYQSKITSTVARGDSIQYVIFPIFGTGSDAMYHSDLEVCTAPMFIKLKPRLGGDVPLMVGGIRRDSTQANMPVVVLANARTANEQIALHIDSIMGTVALYSVTLLSTDDPNYYEGVHLLNLEPNKVYNFGADNVDYYKKGDDILLRPATSNNYTMRQGYNYTFGITMQTRSGFLTTTDGCPVGTVPFTVSVVPDYLRWAPKSKDNNKWNDPENWIGVDVNNVPLHENAHFAPLASTDVIIPAMTDGLPFPELPDPESISSADSVKQVGFVYNTCDDIRFLSGAAIGQQQRLNSDVVVVDMTIPQQTWALRSAPVTGMLSGDLFLSEADLSGETKPWSVGQFDASGRSYKTGNASFWLSVYNKATEQVVREGDNESRTAAAEWSRVTNGMTLSLPAAQGWAVYGRTVSGVDAQVRLPKNDDIYYYYGTYGEKLYDHYEQNLRSLRDTYAGGTAGQLAFHPDGSSQDYTLTNGVESTSFVFGNPTMGYIDIWGFIEDNSLTEEFSYLNAGRYTTVTSETKGTDTITNQARYLPPMHAIVITTASATSKSVRLNANRIVTHPSQKVRGGGGSAPLRSSNRQSSNRQLNKGIMTVTAVNPVSNRCVSRLLLGQGYDDAIRSGEDAVLTTLNIDKFHMTNTPTTPFNIYAMEGEYGLSIDLRNEIINVPVSFYMSELPYDPVTRLWFTGVNAIDGELVFYDVLTDTERNIVDGICMDIETPEVSHETRYYIRRKGFRPDDPSNPIATELTYTDQQPTEKSQKLIRNGHVLIIRNGHVYTMVGQKIR